VTVSSLGPIAPAGTVSTTDRRPNIVVILADDLGYSDLGCYGGEIRTPNLDRLAAGGLRFTQFSNTARCWPTRAALLTGYYAQQVRRDTVPGVPSGSQGTRPKWARLLPEMLRAAGYRSYHSGKWHVDGMPLAGGFDRSYYVQDLGRYFHPRVLFEDDRRLPPVPPGSGYYVTAAIAEHGIKYLREHAERHPGRPFFLFLAFNAPHFPLQALPEDIARYRERYRAGWETIRAERWRRIQDLGIVAGRLSDVERGVGPPYEFPDALKRLGLGEVNRPLPWAELTDAQRAFQATKMTLHAALVDRMDREIGRVLDQLRAMQALDDTLLCFFSDNGASAEIMIRDDGHDPSAEPGSAATHFCLGPGWSTVANTPFRRHKTWVHEGGIATPLIVHWPKGIAARGELRHNPGHVIDLLPTILEVTRARRPDTWEGRPVPGPPGKSLVAAFDRDGTVGHADLWWEHEGNRAIRAGDWKLVAAKGSPWELFDLATDRAETRDRAGDLPEKVRELAQRWQQRWDEFVALARRDVGGERAGDAAGSARTPAPAAEKAREGTGTLRLRIVERKADRIIPVPARVHLADAKGKPVLPSGLPAWRDHFNCDGDVRLDLPAGRYTYTVERGPEYRRVSGALAISAHEAREQDVLLSRIIDLAALGWFSGETHVHRPLADIPLLLRSEDLHVAPVLTVWNKNNHWKDRPLPARLLIEPERNRVYHMLACEDERRGGALLYFNLSRPLALAGDGPEFPSPVDHLRESLDQPGAWVDLEKPFWWDMPTWVATGKVRSIGLANNHMCRLSMYENEAWGRPRDVGEFPPPRGNGFYSQSLYYRLLNCGLRLPPSAGSASGVLPNPVGYNRAYVHLDGPFSYEAWWRGLGEGRSFVTNGPLLLVEADGRHPGAVFRSPGGQARSVSLDIRVLGNDPLEAVEVIRDGVVVERLAGEDLGERVRAKPLVFESSGWFLVRAIAAVPETFRFASTAPFYVEVGESRETVHRDDAAFFLRWIDERNATLQADPKGDLGGLPRKEDVLKPHREAKLFFERLLSRAQ
jgi:arylsulfatase